MSTDSRPPGRRRRRTGLIRVLVVPGITGLLGLFGLVGLPGLPRLASGEDPAAEVTAAVQRFGASGTLWGRLAVEEESPDGAWTPLGAVEITLYPAVPSLVAELEQIRQSARGSGAEYESAISRLRAVLAAHQIRVATVLHGAPPPPKPPDQPKASDSKRPWWAPMKVGQKADPDKAEAAKPQTAKATTAQGRLGSREKGRPRATPLAKVPRCPRERSRLRVLTRPNRMPSRMPHLVPNQVPNQVMETARPRPHPVGTGRPTRPGCSSSTTFRLATGSSSRSA